MFGVPTRATLTDVSGITHTRSGKVRELFKIGNDRLLIVASDRISAFDVVLPDEIPNKGRVLTGISAHWLDVIEEKNHLISTDTSTMGFLSESEKREFAGRAMLVHAAEVIPMECVVRGYLYGSSWREYNAGGGPTTEHLPCGLEIGSRLPEPTFTPASKADSGHDENLCESDARALVGDDTYEELKKRSVELYQRGAEHTANRGIILADTKFEFGMVNDEIVLIDEVLTPDSSRYWPAEEWTPGSTIRSFDKQPVREWLESQEGWRGTQPAPTMPSELIDETSKRYISAYEMITERSFVDYLSGKAEL